jgi:hypothetical protein
LLHPAEEADQGSTAEEGGIVDGGTRRRARNGAQLIGVAMLGGLVLAAVTTRTAEANDRSTAVVCVDEQTGAWEASMTFASIDVREGHPVVITFGSASTTLTAPGPAGHATLTQRFTGGQDSATIAWSVVRNGLDATSGVEHVERPEGCVAQVDTTPPTTPATTTPTTPATVPPATVPPATPPVSGPEPSTSTPTSGSTPAPVHLPVTGGAAGWTTLVAVGAVAAGLLLTRAGRRLPDEVIGD